MEEVILRVEGGYNVREFVEGLHDRPNVSSPPIWQLRQMAETFGIITEFGNLVVSTTVRNRIAGLTVHVGSERVRQRKLNEDQKRILRNIPQTLEKVHKYALRAPLVRVERRMGENDEFTPHCTLYVSLYRKEHVRLPYMWSTLLFEPGRIADGSPHLYILCIPEWPEHERQVLVFPEQGVTYVLGSDYLGELKKGFLRMAMWEAKQRGMLGLHAATKIVKARGPDGRLRRYAMLLFALSATGKTTLACHHHFLDGEKGEGIEIVQDDVVFLKKDGSSLGPERGFFLKTDIDPENHPLIYRAATKRDAVFENVMVDYRGRVDFLDFTLTGNGRGVIQRKDLGEEYVSDSVNTPPLSELDGMLIFFITRRNTILPPLAKLSPEQAAAAFMLGESVETAAGDPRRAGESIRVVGANPFIVGDEAEEGNWFYEFVKEHEGKVQCFLLNTGGVGEQMVERPDGTKEVVRPAVDITIEDTSKLIRAVARGTVEWEEEPYFGTLVPRRAEGVDLDKFDVHKLYSQQEIDEMVEKLKRERLEYLEQFEGLEEAVKKAFV